VSTSATANHHNNRPSHNYRFATVVMTHVNFGYGQPPPTTTTTTTTTIDRVMTTVLLRCHDSCQLRLRPTINNHHQQPPPTTTNNLTVLYRTKSRPIPTNIQKGLYLPLFSIFKYLSFLLSVFLSLGCFFSLVFYYYFL
jgi:hypothetical protein